MSLTKNKNDWIRVYVKAVPVDVLKILLGDVLFSQNYFSGFQGWAPPEIR